MDKAIKLVQELIELKNAPGTHDQRTHGHRLMSGEHGDAYDRIGTSEPYIDEGPEGWEAGPNDVTREDRNVLVPIDLLRSSNVDVVRQAGIQSTRSFGYREQLRNQIESEGLKQGITVAVEQDGKISIIDGTHRLEAVNNLGWKYIPADVRYFGNAQRNGLISEPVLVGD